MHRSLLGHEWLACLDGYGRCILLDLVMMANVRDGRVTIRKTKVFILKRGEVLTSDYELSKQTGFSRKIVRSRLGLLQEVGTILVKRDNLGMVVSICNYDKYQKIIPSQELDGYFDGEFSDASEAPVLKNVKNIKNVKKNNNTTTKTEINTLQQTYETTTLCQLPSTCVEGGVDVSQMDSNPEELPPQRLAPPPKASEDVSWFVSLWNENCGVFAKVKVLTEKRRKAIRSRLAEKSSKEYWLHCLEAAKASPFCCGSNSNHWTATFDWFVRPDTHVRLSEGFYSSSPKAEARPLIASTRIEDLQ